jgi:hypothetical protein
VHGYPLLNLFWTMLWLFLWILWIFLLIRIITDIFRSSDLGGWGKAGWTILLILFPFIGAIAYLVARGGGMHERENRQAQASEQLFRQYVQQAAGPHHSVADELTKLAALRDSGVITEAEFAAQKAKLVA